MSRLFFACSYRMAVIIFSSIFFTASASETQIGKSAKAIDAQKSILVSIRREADEYSLEGATATAWTDGHHIVKIEVEALRESGRNLLDFYYFGADLIAARQRVFDYDRPFGEPGATLLLDSDDYMEFGPKGLSQWTHFAKSLRTNSEDAAKLSANLHALASSFQLLVSASDPEDVICRWQPTAASEVESVFVCHLAVKASRLSSPFPITPR